MKTLVATACVAGLAVVLGTPAFAANYLILSGPNYSDTLYYVNGMLNTASDGSGTSYDGVIQQDKTYNNFSVGGLGASTPVSFTFSTVAGTDYHTISFQPSGGFASVASTVGSSVSWSYDIAIIGSKVFDEIATDLTQPGAGQAGVTTVATDLPTGDVYNLINFTKNGSTPSGTTSQTLDFNDTDLNVVNTFTNIGGTTATALANTFTQVTVPEPSTWAMMGLGFAGLAFAGFRTRRTAIPAA